MIRFFRSIRQQLMNENKPAKYLKYAVGEVLLVMIGILLALQVNNWNEGRKVDQQGMNNPAPRGEVSEECELSIIM